MGSIDISIAKDQFIQLLGSVRAAQLPQFTIWMDQKLAEYKVYGKVPGKAPDQDYPHWIRQALQQHFKSFFGDATPFGAEETVPSESSARSANRKRASGVDSTFQSKVARLSQEPEKTVSPCLKVQQPTETSEFQSRLSDPPTAEQQGNSQRDIEEIVIKDEGVSDDEFFEQAAPFTLKIDKIHSVNNSTAAPLPPLSSAFGMRPPGPAFMLPASQPLVHRFPSVQPVFPPTPRFHMPVASSSGDHTPQSTSKSEAHAVKSESSSRSVRVTGTGGWRRGFEQMLALNGYSGSLDSITPQELDSTLALFFSRARKLDGSPYSQRSYMMRKVDLDKIMTTNLGISFNDLPEATRAYKAKLQEFKTCLTVNDDISPFENASAASYASDTEFKSGVGLGQGRVGSDFKGANDRTLEVFEAIAEALEDKTS